MVDKWDDREKEFNKKWKNQKDYDLPIKPLLVPFYVGIAVGALFMWGLIGVFNGW